jgi:hypothetical protein
MLLRMRRIQVGTQGERRGTEALAEVSRKRSTQVSLQGQSTLTDAEKVTEARKHVEALIDHVAEMAPNEAKFITNLSERFEQYGNKTFVTNKQLFWLRDIRMHF